MNKENVFNKKTGLMILCFVVVLMSIASLFDFQISSALVNQKSAFGIFLASYGQAPAMLCVSISGTLLFQMIDKDKKVKMVLCIVFGILLNLLGILGITLDPTLYIEGFSVGLSFIIAMILVTLTNVIICKYTKDADKEDIKKVIKVFLITMFGSLIVINMIKKPWSRPRMRMILEQGDAIFQPWWVIGCEMKDTLLNLGVKAEEFKSFPSGHTANAACACLLAVLPYIVTSLKGKENTLFLTGFIFTILVAFSRIIMGAHFLSDVTVGMSITLLFEFILVNKYFVKKN